VHLIAQDVRASIAYGLGHRAAALAHAKKYSRGLTDAQTDRFIGMYVNDYTLEYGALGRRAVSELLARAHAAGLVPHRMEPTFVAASP
jgi:1,4-dihydroxy-6-naphthoate synthase